MLETLSNKDLLIRMGRLARTERKITHAVLLCIAEIDRRQLYLKNAFPSLFEFLTKKFGYSASAAVRRIDSARLLQEIPDVAKKLETGALNLSQLSQAQRAFRNYRKQERASVTPENKRAILEKIEFSSAQTTEALLCRELAIEPPPPGEKETFHRDESVSVTIRFQKEELTLLEKVHNIVSHAVPEAEWSKLFLYLAQRELARRLGRPMLKVHDAHVMHM